MDRQRLLDKMKRNLTGGSLVCDVSEATLNSLVDDALEELQRYYDETVTVTIPFQKCIDMTPYKVNAVTQVRRTASLKEGSIVTDPLYGSMWQIVGGINSNYRLASRIQDYAAYNQLIGLRNTISQDCAFEYHKFEDKLYINVSLGFPAQITIDYVPRLENVDAIKSDFWVDVFSQLCVAYAKIAAGRIRSRYTLKNGEVDDDGKDILAEGKEELKLLRENLQKSTQLSYILN